MASTGKQRFPMMTTAVKFAKLLGLWQDTEVRKPLWQTVFVITCLVFWYILPGVAFIAREERPISVLMKSFLEIIGMAIVVVRLGTHLMQRVKLQQCFVEVQTVLSKFSDSPHEDIRKTLKHLRKSSEYLVKIYVPIVMVQAMNYGVIPALLTIVKFILSNETVELPATVFEADFVLFDHRSNFWIWLPVALTSIFIEYCMLGSIAAQECLYWNLLHHLSCLFRIVRMEISRLDWYKDPTQFKEQLITIVDIHEACCQSARCLETALHPVMVVLYFGCICLIFSLMFVVSMVDDYATIASMAFLFQYMTFLIFSFSMLGSELVEESSLVSNAIYNTRWYNRLATERRLLLFMQMRCDRMVGITAGKFFFVTRSTFAGAMKTAFSYFTIMRRLFGDE